MAKNPGEWGLTHSVSWILLVNKSHFPINLLMLIATLRLQSGFETKLCLARSSQQLSLNDTEY